MLDGFGVGWEHVNPYGRFELDMETRLDLSPNGPPVTRVLGEAVVAENDPPQWQNNLTVPSGPGGNPRVNQTKRRSPAISWFADMI